MESQIAPHHPHAHRHESHHVGLHQSVEGEEEDGQHHEKKSVLKKVKAKAKKIKDTITKHGHGSHDYGHDDHEFISHDHEDEDEEEDDEAVEVVGDPEYQVYEGAEMRSVVAGQVEIPSVGYGRSTAIHDQTPSAPRETTSRLTSSKTPTTKVADDSAVAPNTTMSLSPWSLEEDPHAPKDRTQVHAPRTSQVKVADPAARGNEEAGASKILDSFAKMNVNDEHEANQTGLSSESHGQFSPEPNPPKLDATTHESHPRDQSSYAQKISAASSPVVGKAISAKDFVASKLGYGETTGDNTKSSSSPLDYGKKIASTVTQKLAETGSTVMAKIHGRGSGTKEGTAAAAAAAAEGQDKGISVTEYLVQKLTPSEEDRALSEVISEAFHKPKEEATMGKVTESEELMRRLGREDEQRHWEDDEERERSAAAATTGRSVVDKVKETVGSWLGKGGESPTSQQSIGSSQGVEGFMDSSSAGEARGRRRRRQQPPAGTEAEVRILQESAN